MSRQGRLPRSLPSSSRRHRGSFHATSSYNSSGTRLIIACEISRDTKGAHIILWNIVTEARATAAERDGFTERPWQGDEGERGRAGACGIRRFNHPPGERDGRMRLPGAREGRAMPCYWPADGPRLPGRDTSAPMFRVKIEPRSRAVAAASRLPSNGAALPYDWTQYEYSFPITHHWLEKVQVSRSGGGGLAMEGIKSASNNTARYLKVGTRAMWLGRKTRDSVVDVSLRSRTARPVVASYSYSEQGPVINLG